MLCEKCKIKKATVFYTELDRTRHSLCAGCASAIKGEKVGYLGIADSENVGFSPISYLYELAHNENLMYYCNDDVDSPLTCRECSISVSDVLKRGYLNCPDCYAAFSMCPQTNCYGDEEYQKASAQMPHRYSQKLERKQRLELLRGNLRAAIEREDFELAAELRDEIKRMDI